MSHNDRYRKLQEVRKNWCQRGTGTAVDQSNITIEVDGRECVDIPAFYLVLGKAVNGNEGYFGGGLDALDDCLLGGFGLIPPFSIVFHHADRIRENLGESAYKQWMESHRLDVLSDPDYTEEDIKNLGLAGPISSMDKSYFDSIVRMLGDRGVDVIFR